MMAHRTEPLLSVRGLKKHYPVKGGLLNRTLDRVHAVDGVSFDIAPGETLAPALYFSRQCIPSGEGPLWHHIGLYAFRRAALARFVALPASPLETREKLEQLRALEAGMRIDAAIVDDLPLGVDTPADLERARALLGARRLN